MNCFPVVGWYHLNSIPGTAVQERAVRSFADALLAANAEIWIDLDTAERRVIFVGDPKHTGFNRAVLDAGRRASAARATVGRNRQDTGPFLPRGLAIANRHWPVFFNDIVHA